jgi:hypothetical protein
MRPEGQRLPGERSGIATCIGLCTAGLLLFAIGLGRADTLPKTDVAQRSVVELGPELRWTGTSGALSLSGRFQNLENGAWTVDPRLSALARRFISNRVSGSVSLDAGAQRWTGLGRTTRLETAGLLAVGSSRRAIWAGAGAARIQSDGRWSTSGVYHAGATLQVGRTRLSLLSRAASYSRTFSWIDTVFTPGDSLPPRMRLNTENRRNSYSDTGLELLWQGERLGLGMDLSVRLGEKLKDPRASAAATGSYRVTPRVTLVARGGRNPSLPDQGVPSHNFATMALQLDLQNVGEKSYPLHGVIDEPVRPSFDLQPLSGNRRRIRIRLPDAATVEIAGDFTDWNPVPLQNRGLDTWEMDCTIASGPHRTNIRIDGGRWVAPPGLQTLEDEFNGVVGIFIAP